MKSIFRTLAAAVFMLLAYSASAETKKVTMQVGETQTLYLPSSVTSKNLRSVSFYSNGISYVKVTSHTNYSVTVKAIKAFSSPIIVRCDYYYTIGYGSFNYQANGYYDFSITVVGDNKVKPSKITFPSSAVGLEIGESRQLSPTVSPKNAEYTLTWSVRDKTVATVSQDGLLSGKSEGATDLTVKADNGVYAMLRVVVSKPSPSSVSVSPSSLSLKVGDEKYLAAYVRPSNASQNVEWSSSNTNVATVSSFGKVKASATGKCTITAKTSNNKTATCTVNVSPKVVSPTAISLNPENASIEEGESIKLTAEISPKNATTTLTWTSSDKEVASVSNGTISGLSAGTCKITVSTANGLSATSTINVRAKELLPQSVSLPHEPIKLAPGEDTTLSASVYPGDARSVLTWKSSDSDVATVLNGKVSAINEGICTISVATQNGLADSCEVVVEREEPMIVPSSDWSGTYRMKASVVRSENAEYGYPEDFLMEIAKGEDGAYYITSFIGLDVTKSYPYTGLKLNILSDTEASIDLDYSNNAGGWTVDGEYTDGLYLLSSNSQYDYWNLGTITLTRGRDNEMTISDFYVYCFGLSTDYQYSKEAHYTNCRSVSEPTGIESAHAGRHDNGKIEIYSLSGQLIYAGSEADAPELEKGIYVIRKGGKAVKFLKSK